MWRFLLALPAVAISGWAQQNAPARTAIATPTRAQINQVVAKHEGIGLSAWGAKVVNLSTGQTLYTKDADHYFLPASNTKLFTTAFALSRLGPDFRFTTRVIAADKPDANGVVDGDLTIIGGGDPTISGRQYPNQETLDDIPDLIGDPWAAVDALIKQLSDAGVRRIKGDIVGDDRAYVWEPYPAGWAENDTLSSDGAPVSALMFADNRVNVAVRTGETEADAPQLLVTPETGYFHITSLVRPGAQNRIQERREPGSRYVELRGEIKRGTDVNLAVDDPARYFAHIFRLRLLERGIAVDGVARAHHRYREGDDKVLPDLDRDFGVELARRQSPPLVNIIRLVNKASQNLHAEVLLREAGRDPGKAVTRASALAAMRDFLSSLGINGGEVELSDGSGLSRLNLVTPDAVVKLLRAMSKNEYGSAWMSSLPVAGNEGTLKDRFDDMKQHPELGKVMAKTGTLRHSTALSGYYQTPDKQLLAFSLLTNNVNASNGAARSFVDDLVMMFVKCDCSIK